MKILQDNLRRIKLFNGLHPVALMNLLEKLHIRVIFLTKGEFLFHAGDPVVYFGAVLSGSLNLVDYKSDGSEKIIEHIATGEMVGENVLFARIVHYPLNVIAAEDSHILLLDGARFLSPSKETGCLHVFLLMRMLKIIAFKNMRLFSKIEYISQRKISNRILSFLEDFSATVGENPFTIPYTRQQLADYLSVDRCALCSEISKLVKAGIIENHRRTFKLLKVN